MAGKDKIQRISKSMKREPKKLPKGAKVLEKDTDVSVREIENGFIVSKSVNIRFQLDDNIEYDYYTKEYYSETDPLKITDKSLADIFE